MGINISSNYIPAININTGISVSGTLSVNSNSLYDVTNYQTVNITGAEDLLKTRLNTPSQITSYSNDNLTYLAPATFYSTGITAVDLTACTSIGSYTFYQCSSLTTANFPSCTTIGNYAFSGCYLLSTVSFPACTSMGNYAVFYSCRSLTSVDFPVCINVGVSAFRGCSSLTTANFPSCTRIGNYAFSGCYLLSTVSFPACTYITNYAFAYCYLLSSVSFPSCTRIGSAAFRNCYHLLSLYLLGSSLCSLGNANAFSSTPISGYTTSTGGVYGSIYVPASLYNSYIVSTN